MFKLSDERGRMMNESKHHLSQMFFAWTILFLWYILSSIKIILASQFLCDLCSNGFTVLKSWGQPLLQSIFPHWKTIPEILQNTRCSLKYLEGLPWNFRYTSLYYFHVFLNVGIQQCLKHTVVQKKREETYIHPCLLFPTRCTAYHRVWRQT